MVYGILGFNKVAVKINILNILHHEFDHVMTEAYNCVVSLLIKDYISLK